MDQHLHRPGATLAYSITGPADADRTLLVAHPVTASRAYDDAWGVFDWSPVVATGESLVRFDTRGHGQSTGDAREHSYRWPCLADDFLALGHTVQPSRPVDGLGQSTGCGVLLWAAVTAPVRFRRLVLVIPPTMGEARANQAELFRAAASLVELRGMDAWHRAATTLPPIEILAQGGWPRNLDPTIDAELLPAALRGEADSDLPDDASLAALHLPTLILAWSGDAGHPTAAAEALHRLLPQSTLEIATSPADIRRWGARTAEFLS